MPESWFTALFKYRPVLFENGELAWLFPRPMLAVAIALVAVAVLAAGYWRQRARAGSRTILALTGVRILIVAVLLWALLHPVIRISRVVPGENFMAVLIDDSRSMQLTDDGTATRGAQALSAFAPGAGDVTARLEERFTVRHYRFSDVARRMDPGTSLGFDGRATTIGAALDFVRQDLTGVPLSGIVLVSDGADNADTTTTESLLQLKSRGIPVYTVGLGEARFPKDIEVARIEAPDRVLQGAAYAVDVMLEQRGFDGRTVELIAEDNGIIVGSEDVTFERGQTGASARMILTATEAGPRDLRFSVTPAPDERVRENNVRTTLMSVEDQQEKILYFEGEPRFEVKFLRQALADDEYVRVVVLQRTAENKYLRLGVDDPLELASGFPSTREELFAYRGLILGSVEASYFTHNQLQIIEEFVSQRGGGLLLLGGRESFAEGGYAGTPLENVLPVVLETPRDPDAFLAEMTVSPTTAGARHAATLMAPSADESDERWETLPPLTTPNPLYRIKPGATVLLTGAPVDGSDDLVVLASQRYGRGRAVVFNVQDSWLWQMHADIALEDMSHERLWRQMSRWLLSSVPDQITIETNKKQFVPGEPVAIRAGVRDSSFLGINGAEVMAVLTDPTGEEFNLPLEWTVEEDGEYRGTFLPQGLGVHDIRVEAAYAGQPVGVATDRIRAADLPTEYFGAERHDGLLRRIADQTGGRFYTSATMAGVAEDAQFTASGKTVVETYDLWDMPIVFVLLLGCLTAEWALRRRRGLI